MNLELINPSELAERWNVPQATLSQWRWNGKGPLYLKLGRRVAYRIKDIEEFEQKRLKASTSSNNSEQ